MPRMVWASILQPTKTSLWTFTNATGNPPATVLEAAASIAAFYSKSRHSNLVPVIYTHRKYVRKFRGAKPGQVMCEREKTIFVEPKLPE